MDQPKLMDATPPARAPAVARRASFPEGFIFLPRRELIDTAGNVPASTRITTEDDTLSPLGFDTSRENR